MDVSERFAAEEFRTVVTETMIEGLYALDGNGRLTYINGAACTMLGWDADELRELNIHQTIHFQRADGSPLTEDECPIFVVRTGGRPVKLVEDTFTRRDGTMFPVTYSAAPIPSDGPHSGVVVVFRDATEERAKQLRAQRELETLHWLGRIREAIDEDRLVLYSQPIIPLSGGKPAEELLVRIVGRDGEIIAPGAFLPAAEQYGLIEEIDRWVISRAIRIAAAGRRVEVNLSAKSVSDRLLEFIREELVAADADPSNVIFELTETALLDDIAAGEHFAAGVAEIGCGLALDDFGTGFASLTYLRVLPAEYLKIDIEFVRDLTHNETNQHLVRSIIHLARGLDKKTIAEGVENEEVLALLRSFGVDYAQGFHLGRPQPVDAVTPPQDTLNRAMAPHADDIALLDPVRRLRTALAIAEFSSMHQVGEVLELAHPLIKVRSVPGIAPGPGYVGHAELGRYFADAAMHEASAAAVIHRAEVTTAGNVLAAGMLSHGQSGDRSISAWFVIRFRDGLISAVETYLDAEAAWEQAQRHLDSSD